MTYAPGELRDQRMRGAADCMRRPEPLSLAQRDALLPEADRARLIEALTPDEWLRLLHDWRYWARPTQLAPAGHWIIWLILSGRGWGKTRTGVEWMREEIDRGEAATFGLIGPTRNETLDRLVYGDEAAPGLVRLYDHFPEALRPVVNKNDATITFKHVPSVGHFYTAEKKEIRGPNMRRWLCDEAAHWPNLRACWDNIEMTTRARGRTPPRICMTTTPRPIDVLKDLLDDTRVTVTWGNTFANAANVAPEWIRSMATKYAGTRLGLQEIYGLLLGDNPDALFHQTSIDRARVTDAPRLVQIVIAIDPAIATGRRNDLTGILVMGRGVDGELYVLADLTGVAFDRKAKGLVYWRPDEPKHHGPEEWGELVVRAYRHFGREYGVPVLIVGERNRGGDLVRSNVLQVDKLTGGAGAIPYREVLAIRGKAARAEEVSTLYEQGRVHHVGNLPDLETEITEWNPQATPISPNRLDALVWGVFGLVPELATGEQRPEPVAEAARVHQGFAEANAAMPRGDFAASVHAEPADYDRI